jgi:hypothetical protein
MKSVPRTTKKLAKTQKAVEKEISIAAGMMAWLYEHPVRCSVEVEQSCRRAKSDPSGGTSGVWVDAGHTCSSRRCRFQMVLVELYEAGGARAANGPTSLFDFDSSRLTVAQTDGVQQIPVDRRISVAQTSVGARRLG